jgi:hypothetical protein
VVPAPGKGFSPSFPCAATIQQLSPIGVREAEMDVPVAVAFVELSGCAD